jgi:ABC-type dipeptide/oligopeptide/nickel transport system permease subunit
VRGAVVGIVRDYFRSPVGIAALAVFLGIVVLAVVGPMLSSDEYVIPWVFSSTDMFLEGAAPMVAVPIGAAVIASAVGVILGVVMGLARPYADGLFAGAAQGIMAMPFVCLAALLLLARNAGSGGYEPEGYLSASLDFMWPVAALVALSVCHGFVSARRRRAAAGGGPVPASMAARFGPAIASWTLGALKFGVPMTVLAVFLCDFLSVTNLASWGWELEHAYMWNMLMTGEWDYVVLPLVGTALLVASTFLVIDTLERLVRTRFADLV